VAQVRSAIGLRGIFKFSEILGRPMYRTVCLSLIQICDDICSEWKCVTPFTKCDVICTHVIAILVIPRFQ
jgi:hypothetical protein